MVSKAESEAHVYLLIIILCWRNAIYGMDSFLKIYCIILLCFRY